jgi:hypothetical protein
MPRQRRSRPSGPTPRARTEVELNAGSVRDFHESWAWVLIISNAIAGSWALGAHWLTPLRTKALWWFTGFAQLTVFVQAIVGVVLVNRYGFELDSFHALYGFSAIIAVAIIYSYRVQMRHRLYLLYGLGGLFIMGLGIRELYIAAAR